MIESLTSSWDRQTNRCFKSTQLAHNFLYCGIFFHLKQFGPLKSLFNLIHIRKIFQEGLRGDLAKEIDMNWNRGLPLL